MAEGGRSAAALQRGQRARGYSTLVAALVVWSAELMLMRLSDSVVPLREVALSAACYLALALALCGLAASLRGRAAEITAAIAVSAPAFVAIGGLLLFAWIQERRLLAVGVALAGAGLCSIAVAGCARARRRAVLVPVAIVLSFLLAASAIWLARRTGPGAPLWAALVVAWLALAYMARTRLGACLAAVGALVVSQAPFGLALDPDWPEGRPAAQGPDILLIVVDTLRAEDAMEMAAYRQLALDGVEFEQVQASSSWTLPTMASLFTGLPVAEHGAGRLPAKGERSAIAEDSLTLAERLALQGYDTAAVLARNPFLGREFGFERGFAFFDFAGDRFHRAALPSWWHYDPVARPAPVIGLVLLARTLRSASLHRLAGVARIEDAEAVVDRALRLLAEERDRPIFLWLHLMDTHLPYRHVLGTSIAPELKRRLLETTAPVIREDPSWATPSGVKALREAYLHEMEVVDRALLRLLEDLGEPPLRGRVIVLTSDHGEEFFEHGGFEHGHAFYQEVIGVPLVVAGMGGESRRVTRVVGQVEVAETLEAAARGLHSSPAGRGLFSKADHPRPYTAQNLLYWSRSLTSAVRRGQWKLIDGAETELYDLAADPAESRSLTEREPEVAASLRVQLPDLLEGGRAVPLEPHVRRSLESLGYIE